MPNDRTNKALADRLAETRWTNEQLAQAVNRAGREAGLTLKYDRTAVGHWLGGTMPRARVRPVILEALSRRLHRPVTASEAGFPSTPSADRRSAGTVADLMDLPRADMDPSRRAVLASSTYSAALHIPAFSDLAGRLESTRAGRTTRIGAGEVSVVRSMTSKVADILDELGGGHARPMAAAFMANTLGPYLDADASEAVHKDMLSAASDFWYLTGWMAMYETEHTLGQRYYMRALDLARTAQDHVTYCRTLRGMALQAAHLGHGRTALEYANSAAEAAPKAGPRLRAFLSGQQAHGAALVGDRHGAFARLRETEAALSKADNRRESIGGYDRSAFEFHVSSVLYALGDVSGSVEAMHASNRARPSVERQGNAHAHGLLAQRQLEMGHLEAACDTWDQFLDDYAVVSSRRADEHFRIMRTSIRPYARNARARALWERARETGRQKA